MKDKIVVFAPHPDDEVLGCGGTIARRLSEGYDVLVVFLTDGRYSLAQIDVPLQPSPIELKEIRKEEAKKAAKMLGVPERNLIFFDIEDGILEQNRSMAQDLIAKVLESSPTEIYFPQEKEFNLDHRAANHLVRDAIRKLDLHTLEYQYMIAWLYPLNLIPRLRPQRLQDTFVSMILGQEVIHIDVSEFLSLKKAALEEYQSQLSILSDKQRRPALKDSFVKRFLKNKEDFVRRQ